MGEIYIKGRIIIVKSIMIKVFTVKYILSTFLFLSQTASFVIYF